MSRICSIHQSNQERNRHYALLPSSASPALTLGAAIAPAIYGVVTTSGSDADEENSVNSIQSTFTSETSEHGNRTITSSTTTRSYRCHDGWLSWSMVKYLYFKAPTQQPLPNDTIVCITTPWYAHYSDSIKSRLEEELGLQSVEMQQQCGWIEIAQVNAARVWRGNAEWYNERFMDNGKCNPRSRTSVRKGEKGRSQELGNRRITSSKNIGDLTISVDSLSMLIIRRNGD